MACCVNKGLNGFQPNFREKPITEKFYARHDRLSANAEKREKISYYEEIIGKRLQSNQRHVLLAPVTENQMYGWLEHRAIRYSEASDVHLFCHPRILDTTMRIQQKIYHDLMHNRRLNI